MHVVHAKWRRNRAADDDADTGDHNRNEAVARSTKAAMVTIVTTTTTGGAADGVPSGALPRMSKTMGMTVAAISMITVPETTGVNTRRRTESRAARAN